MAADGAAPALPDAAGIDARLRAAFTALERGGISYVILRGYRPLAELGSTVDIDIFMSPQSLQAALPLLRDAGWRARRSQTGRHPHHFIDCWEGGPGFVRSLDVVTDLVYGEALQKLDRAHLLLSGRRSEEGVGLPSPPHALFTFALHVVLDKGRLSDANRARAHALIEEFRRASGAREAILGAWGPSAAAFVSDFIGHVEDPASASIEALQRQARALPVLRAQPLLGAWDRVRRRFRQFRRPVARVAILGIDGSGKSTMVARLCEAPSTLRVTTGYLGGNKFRTPPTRWMQARLAEYEARGDQSSVGFRILANLNTLWWPFELIARMMIAEHRSELVVYDRFPLGQDDVEPTSLWGRTVFAYSRLMRRLRPAPDLVVMLDGDDRVLWERKREFPFEVHQRTQKSYRRVVASLTGETAVVRTDQDPAKSFSALCGVLAASIAIRQKLY